MLSFIHGINIFLLCAVPVKTSQSIALQCINLMRILVPFVFKFLISKTMLLTFNIISCGGKPLIVKEFKNSTRQLLMSLSLSQIILSQLFTRNLINYISIIQSTIIILGAKITESNILSESLFSEIFPYTSLILFYLLLFVEVFR